jgi:hypothetical protein
MESKAFDRSSDATATYLPLSKLRRQVSVAFSNAYDRSTETPIRDTYNLLGWKLLGGR